MKILIILLILSCLTIICFKNSFATDTLKPGQTLVDNGHDSLVSIGGRFEFGFFSPGNSKRRYIGIRYKIGAPESTAVWIANRENPLEDRSGVLRITRSGNILLLGNRSNVPIWSSNSSKTNPSLQLLDMGNLIVTSADSESYAWQSSDHPQDTQTAGMKLGTNLKTGHVWRFSSWTSPHDPSPGEFTIELEPRLPQVIQRRRSAIFYRSPPWNGVQFGRNPNRHPNFRIMLISDETQVYYTFETADATVVRFWASPNGSVTLFRWIDGSRDYLETLSYPMMVDECDRFAWCGPNSVCKLGVGLVPRCSCPDGFVPRGVGAGCVLKARWACSGDGERFVKLSGLKLPYSSDFLVDKDIVNVTECEMICRRNCSCVAYSVAVVGGCVVWFGDLLDIKVYGDLRGQDLYLRIGASSESVKDGNKIRTTNVIITATVISGFLIIMISCIYIIRQRTLCSSIVSPAKRIKSSRKYPILLEEDVELFPFGFDSIAKATNNFSAQNKIGHGGFGPVYKGILQSGQEIAVKRLSTESGQGSTEFENEVTLISKLQHRNLVKLLGHCVRGEEKILIYEYMPNKSLDLYIFSYINKPRPFNILNQTKDTVLDWQRRYDIIVGVARGLLYLHRDSRLRVIHRDLKATNILLDGEMIPKISDFGLAKILAGGEQTEVETNRIVGTYGYMSPEYAIRGHFSVKSDVFSFGVMVLEIVSGKKNREFEHPDHDDLNLLGHAWELWNRGIGMEFVDCLMEKFPVPEVIRCIEIGLLCVQKCPESRPSISSVVWMLDGNGSLPQPRKPGFYFERVSAEADYAQLSITKLYGR